MDIIDDMLDPQQYGSHAYYSTTGTLAELVHGWLRAVETTAIVLEFYC